MVILSPLPDPHPNQGHIEDLNDQFDSVRIMNHSSSDDEEHESENFMGYQPLPQEPPSEQEDVIDYNSLSGLMTALNDHGPTEIENNDELENAVKSVDLTNCPENKNEEQISLWSSKSGKDFEIDKEKVEEIKLYMSNFQLPSSTFPEWAENLSDKEIINHLKKEPSHLL